MRLTWKDITSEKRIPEHDKNDANRFRSEMESDYHRIIRSASFRRLQDKTQVFPLDQSDFVRTRLTHSLEVASLAKLIGKQVCNAIKEGHLEQDENLPDILTVVEILNCAGLLHDIGNPPFGHFGETAIRTWFQQNLDHLMYRGLPLSKHLDKQQLYDLYHFEGNAQALRIISKLHRVMGVNGLHLTSAVMDTIIKYPVSSLAKVKAEEKDNRSLLEKKIGYFQSETDLYQQIKQNTGTQDCRNPLCFILEAADDLAYTFADLEDGYNKGMYTFADLKQIILQSGDTYSANLLDGYLEKELISGNQNQEDFDPYKTAVFTWLTRKQLFCVSQVSITFIEHYDEIMSGSFKEELLMKSKEGALISALKKFAYKRIYQHSSILKIELMGNEVISFLLTRFVEALIPYDGETKMGEIQEKYIQLLSKNYLDNYHDECKEIDDIGGKLYHRLLLATDFIAGMTDSYAKRLYRELRGIG
ncbi:deoxyguanosinetriphosphate triphosphohydrolase [[Eubacterium] hominis]|uniref:deoxyguanosinetriphosphate triphosphohydrolase n=1 Tax=[Eubacterium] hominis TaxID=2764325 RepID=UPI003A4E1E24